MHGVAVTAVPVCLLVTPRVRLGVTVTVPAAYTGWACRMHCAACIECHNKSDVEETL